MKYLLPILLFPWLVFSGALEQLNQAKAEFQKPFAEQDYAVADSILRLTLESDPENPEVWYYWGYALSRLNSKDGKSIIQMNWARTQTVSDAFEETIRLSPKYKGEIVVLDPYSKISAEWGSLAMSYLAKNQMDSAKISFQEGVRRGGFSKFNLEWNRQILASCKPNAILMTSGDMISMTLWYLQTVEGFRKDVTTIDVSLLNTQWYPHYLKRVDPKLFKEDSVELDAIAHGRWDSKTVRIGPMEWLLESPYEDNYILRSDLLLLSLLRTHLAKRTFYFTIGFNSSNQLGLASYLSDRHLVEELTPMGAKELSSSEYLQAISNLLLLYKKVNLNSTDEVNQFNSIRYLLLGHCSKMLNSDDKESARKALQMYEQSMKKHSIPLIDPNVDQFLLQIKERL